MMPLWAGMLEVVTLLLDHGAAIDDRELESGATPLMMAASMGRVEVVTLLLKRGANRQLRDKAGHTALDRARDTENVEIVQATGALKRQIVLLKSDTYSL